MKKKVLLSVAILTSLVLGLTGCGSNGGKGGASGKFD